MEVKEALKDARFRNTLPDDLKEAANKYLNNPGCPCHMKTIRRILKECRSQLSDYFPGAEIVEEVKEVAKLARNSWRVINCKITALEAELKKLPPGRKQLAVSRYQDDVTVVVNELDVVY
jgi:hypothetical protein